MFHEQYKSNVSWLKKKWAGIQYHNTISTYAMTWYGKKCFSIIKTVKTLHTFWEKKLFQFSDKWIHVRYLA